MPAPTTYPARRARRRNRCGSSTLPSAHVELESLLADVQVLGLRSRTQLNAQTCSHGRPGCCAVGAYCTGTNNIDLKAASERGVVVFNGPFSNTRSVAELVIGHAIHLLRRIPERHAAARRGQWLKDSRGSNEIRGKTLGIIGYGKIGMQTGLLAEAIGMRVVYHDIEARLPLGNATPAATLDRAAAARPMSSRCTCRRPSARGS
jgi:D-3-phosphoglycerate dehydrogenase